MCIYLWLFHFIVIHLSFASCSSLIPWLCKHDRTLSVFYILYSNTALVTWRQGARTPKGRWSRWRHTRNLNWGRYRNKRKACQSSERTCTRVVRLWTITKGGMNLFVLNFVVCKRYFFFSIQNWLVLYVPFVLEHSHRSASIHKFLL